MDSGKEISSEFVIAGGDCSVVLDFVPETLGEITLAIEREIASRASPYGFPLVGSLE